MIINIPTYQIDTNDITQYTEHTEIKNNIYYYDAQRTQS